MNGTPLVLLESFSAKHNPASYRFDGFIEVVSAFSADEVIPALRKIEDAAAGGLHAAGFVSYEAAPGLGTGLAVRKPRAFPLVWFGIFRHRYGIAARFPAEQGDPTGYQTLEWKLSLSHDAYESAVSSIKDYIAAGDTYQVNFTQRLHFHFSGDPHEFYRDLCRSQQAPFCSFIDTGRSQIVSASPELFFELKHGTLTCRPMKGTARRGRWHAEDEKILNELRESEKERAENLMITDLLRNDMGIVSETGSVHVSSLFDVETLETVHQMTSTISSRLKPGVGLVEIFQALFPCGSVTGAPKKRSMEIIRELEDSPRGLYTGCIGYVSPGGDAVFSVAIRTAVIDGTTGEGELGIGSGITIGSSASAEYEECLAKARFARERTPSFQLVETMLFEEGKGYFLLDRHLARLYRSADYFGFDLRLGQVKDVLERRAIPLTGSHKVRLLVTRRGAFTIQTEPLATPRTGEPLPVIFAAARTDSSNPFLYHKTTHRPLYTAELAARPDCADIIFLNERNEVTEGVNNNIVARIDNELVTPPLSSGILPGVFREELLAMGEITERGILKEELEAAKEIYLVNSVRKWRRAILT